MFVPPLRGGRFQLGRFPRIALRSILGYFRPSLREGCGIREGYGTREECRIRERCGI